MKSASARIAAPHQSAATAHADLLKRSIHAAQECRVEIGI
jgi:hypothetical protein